MSFFILHYRWITSALLATLIVVSLLTLVAPAEAASIFGPPPPGTGLTETDNPYPLIGKLINTFLTVLGTVAFGLIVYAGYLWMTAQGNTEQVEKAQQILVQATIGLIIIAASWAIASFITTKVSESIAK